MDERELREWIAQVKAGSLSRREFTRLLAGLGLTAPIAAQMLGAAGVPRRAAAQAKAFTPPGGAAGAGEGPLVAGPHLLNPHLSIGVKDVDGSRIFYEPLSRSTPRATTPGSGDRGPDPPERRHREGRAVGHLEDEEERAWHDGKPFTADDIVFNWEYAADPASTAMTSGAYKDVTRIDKLDSHTAKIAFKRPAPFPFEPFCGPLRQVIPKHVFEPFKGAKSREAPANLKPVGTGPYRIVDFKPGDSIKAEVNPNYHVANWPFFDRLELKGGGDAVSAARAVIQTGEYDFAWNIQVEDDILVRWSRAGSGKIEIAPRRGDRVHLRQLLGPLDRGGGRVGNPKSTHPFFADPAVRQACLLIDRSAVQEQIYGRQGQARRTSSTRRASFARPT